MRKCVPLIMARRLLENGIHGRWLLSQRAVLDVLSLVSAYTFLLRSLLCEKVHEFWHLKLVMVNDRIRARPEAKATA